MCARKCESYLVNRPRNSIWTLGTTITKIGWPRCGEIDLMEFVGKEPDRIHGTVHFAENGRHKSNGGKLKAD